MKAIGLCLFQLCLALKHQQIAMVQKQSGVEENPCDEEVPDCEDGCADNDEAWKRFDECIASHLEVSAGDISAVSEDDETSIQGLVLRPNAYETRDQVLAQTGDPLALIEWMLADSALNEDEDKDD